MAFVDELYAFYKDKLTADDEDIDIVVRSIMDELSREDMLSILAELKPRELEQITGTYIAYKLKEKLIGEQGADSFSIDKSTYLH